MKRKLFISAAYAPAGLDITNSVIQNLNRGYRKDAKDPADAKKGINKHTSYEHAI